MNTTPLATTLALGSLILGMAAAALFVYVGVSRWRKKEAARQVADDDARSSRRTQSAAETPSLESSGSSPSRRKKPHQYSLFVIFNQPGPDTDERLTHWLRDKNATFDPLTHVFHIDGEQPSSPITVANAFPPGEMPDLLRGETHAPIRGISLLVKPPLRRRRNQQMIVYVDLAKEMRELFDGEMLDSERAPATDDTYEAIING